MPKEVSIINFVLCFLVLILLLLSPEIPEQGYLLLYACVGIVVFCLSYIHKADRSKLTTATMFIAIASIAIIIVIEAIEAGVLWHILLPAIVIVIFGCIATSLIEE